MNQAPKEGPSFSLWQTEQQAGCSPKKKSRRLCSLFSTVLLTLVILAAVTLNFVFSSGTTRLAHAVALQSQTTPALPGVSMLTPTDGAFYTLPARITLTAGASDSNVGATITKVEFYVIVNSETTLLVGTATVAPYSVTWTPTQPGIYGVQAKAYDSLGEVGTAPTIAVQVLPPGTTPTPTPPSPVTIGQNWELVAAINAGGSAAGNFSADADFDQGSSFSDASTAIDTRLIRESIPQTVWQSYRSGPSFTYTIPNVLPGQSYILILDWAELIWQAPGKRMFNVAIGNQTVLSNFDVYALAGYKTALQEEFTVTGNSNSQLPISFTQGSADHPFISGIEVWEPLNQINGTPTATISPTVPVTVTSTPTVCTVSFTIVSQWPGGFEVNLVLTNTGTTTINGWSLTFSFANGQAITQIWNGSYTQTGSAVTVTNLSYNGTLAPGSAVHPGFNGSWSGTNSKPTAFRLNGQVCAVA